MNSKSIKSAKCGSLVLLMLALLVPGALRGQSTEDRLRAQLVHQPLYLRGFWTGFALEFDSTGRPMGRDLPQPGPLTLSGIDVSDLSIHGKKLMLEASLPDAI